MIFFDIDNTLIDHSHAEIKAYENAIMPYLCSNFYENQMKYKLWNSLSEEYYNKYLRTELTFLEQGTSRVLEFFTRNEISINKKEAKNLFSLYVQQYTENFILFPDVLPVISKFTSKFPMGIISNGNYSHQLDKLKKTKINQYFSCFIISEEYNFTKPDKEIFDIACQIARCPNKSCFYIGDNFETDAKGSYAAGLNSIWLNRRSKGISYDNSIITIEKLTHIDMAIKFKNICP
ncbi:MULTISPECIES: HAD family hydrolase [Bacillus cereus group]|uniref:HAD superfamily hydrolase n=1 Tax=Bacillus thuringiensis TaxID=1428 RepID=A0A1C4E498_BACTU|nr:MULTISPECIES: HAD family hydrolase [Bacillus cereus group]MED3025677.1 HAD family hydrolase [Bacillus wiedmannii]OTX98540.1 hypothetical protein BK729_13315 [Bacillus thuringiensis serovar wratislaviensis]OUB59142.1 hypothetical protein BK743_13210 [Bacillus thuringiensis serovar sylvestriensis]SCC38325.1 HAD superfamily hydrolase [Bacillus thuringiensis]